MGVVIYDLVTMWLFLIFKGNSVDPDDSVLKKMINLSLVG